MFCKLLQNNPDVTQQIVELLTGKKLGISEEAFIKLLEETENVCRYIDFEGKSTLFFSRYNCDPVAIQLRNPKAHTHFGHLSPK